MAMSPSQLGAAFELRVKARLEKAGFFVIKSGGSRGVADLVALRHGSPPLMVQAKRGGYVGVDEWNRLLKAAEAAGALPLVAEQLQPRGCRWWLLRAPKGLSKGRQPWDEWFLT